MLEVLIKPGEPPVKLQRGPKSYCYGPFVKALELCHANENRNNDAVREDREKCSMQEDEDDQMPGGLEAFLDSCDNELDEEDDEGDDNDDDDLGDYFYSTSADATNATESEKSCHASMVNDVHAVDVFKEVLQNVKAGCLKNPLASFPHNQHGRNDKSNEEDDIINNITVEDRYCGMLIRSEILTLDFYMAASDVLRCQLMGKLPSQQKQEFLHRSGEPMVDTTADDYQFDNSDVVREQIDALATAYLSIRYPQLKTGLQSI